MSIVMDDKELIKELTERNAILEEELEATKEHLKKYTAPAYKKAYYQRNKEEHKKRVREYQIRTNYKNKNTSKPTPENKKEYNRRAYLKRKEKMKDEKEPNNENIKETLGAEKNDL